MSSGFGPLVASSGYWRGQITGPRRSAHNGGIRRQTSGVEYGMKLKSASLVAWASLVLAVVFLIAMGPWSPRSHSRVSGTFDDLVIPVGWEFVHESRSGNTACADQCPTVTRIFWVPGNLTESTDEVREFLEQNGFDVSLGAGEAPAPAPARRALHAAKGPVKVDVTVIEGSIDTAIDHPLSPEAGRSGVVMSLQVQTFRDGVYIP